MYNARDAERARRKRLKEHGLCILCGKRSVTVGYATCDVCRERSRASEKRRREKLKSFGMCVKCGKRPPEPGRTRCAGCTEREKKRKKVGNPDVPTRKEKQQMLLYTLCIDCKHAVPTADGKCGCEWSLNFQPVPGWTAEKRVMNANGVSGNPYTSYKVKKCPKFVKG